MNNVGKKIWLSIIIKFLLAVLISSFAMYQGVLWLETIDFLNPGAPVGSAEMLSNLLSSFSQMFILFGVLVSVVMQVTILFFAIIFILMVQGILRFLNQKLNINEIMSLFSGVQNFIILAAFFSLLLVLYIRLFISDIAEISFFIKTINTLPYALMSMWLIVKITKITECSWFDSLLAVLSSIGGLFLIFKLLTYVTSLLA